MRFGGVSQIEAAAIQLLSLAGVLLMQAVAAATTLELVALSGFG
jgi:hypothetical protein